MSCFRLFRHSFLAQYDLYNIATGRRTKLQPDLDELIKALGGGGPGGPPPPPPVQAQQQSEQEQVAYYPQEGGGGGARNGYIKYNSINAARY